MHALLESLESSSHSERCWAIRDFIRERYRYAPTYLEDPAVASWLKNVSRGRDNVHLAALHAGRDARHLGRGVCYELNVLACEMMRRSGVPAAIASGWTLDRGQADAPDHLWAVGLLATVAGPRWMPVDASTTRDGRPLHVAERPAGPWRVRAQKKTEPAASPTPDWVPPARTGRGAGMQGAAEQRGFRVQSPSRGAAPERARREPERPLREMIRVLRYLDRKTGAPLSDEERMRRAQLLLQKPQELRERLFDEPDE